ncbi:hypothetical protein [Bacteroides nordii]|uniref:hypothetical protein n=1 Tax=Bacteroides nordii TaxID=291645 RepID=UPI00189904A5|nr:hypothetical protein [Bacteroides nordii]
MKTIKLPVIQFLLMISLGILFCFFSCQEELVEEQFAVNTLEPTVKVDDNLQLKKDFAKALAKVLGENQEVREIIKNEALKKFDYDYDVLYFFIKDKELSNGLTLEDMLLKHINLDKLSMIQERIPTLTIFVPELPENSFSAEIWNTNNDIPLVGVRMKYEDYTPLYDLRGNESILEGKYIPTYPVVVIKENERIIAESSSSSSTLSRGNGGAKFAFIDDAFDNISKKEAKINSTARAGNVITGVYEYTYYDSRGVKYNIVVPELFHKILDAYDVYVGRSGWQRDYIYYNLTPENPEGPFNTNFKESVIAFEMVGDANTCLAKISDQSTDPQRNDTKFVGSRATYWTEGEFEFQVRVYLGTKVAFGNELITFFRVKPTELFNMEYIRDRDNPQNMMITGVTNRRVYLSTPLPLFEWDLENYSASVKIAIEEVDDTQTTKEVVTTSSEFATNFSFSANWGEKVKVGTQFGASNKEVRTTSYEVTTTHGNDVLGEVIVNFGDDVIVSRDIIMNGSSSSSSSGRPTVGGDALSKIGTLDFNKKYSTGWYRLFIAPVKTN